MAKRRHPVLSCCGKMNIGCFSETRKKLPNGRCIVSDAIARPGPVGHSWHIAFYPNGKLPGTTDVISLYLVLDDDDVDGAAADDIHYHVTVRFKLYEVGGGVPLVTYADFVGGVLGSRAEKAFGFERFITMQGLENSGVLEHDEFTIGCEFTIWSTWIDRPTTVQTPPDSALPDHVVSAPPPSAPLPELSAVKVKVPSDSSELFADLGRLLETKEGADVQFEVRGKVFAAHKLVVAARSPVFKAEFFGPAKEETAISSRNIPISDMDPKVFEALLHYMYTDTLPEMEDEEGDAVLALDLLVAADRYNLKGLKTITEDRLCNYIDVSRIFKMLAVAEGYRCCKLKKMCLEFVGSRKNTSGIVANEDLERLARGFPSLFKDVIAKILDAREETPCDSLVCNINYDLFYFVFILFAVIAFIF